MIRTKIKCELCGREISKSNFTKHLETHKNGNFDKFNNMIHLDHDDLFCKYCGKECKNKNSLAQHEIRCKENPDKINTIIDGFNNKSNHIAWNKGLTKETDNRIKKCSETFHKNHKLGKHKSFSHQHTKEHKQKMSILAKKNGLGGFAWRKGILYNNIKLDSSYEVIVAKSLDENNIKWERPNRIKYFIGNEEHHYTPDFYLPEYDVYLDPKNDFLINNPNPKTGIFDIDKIKIVEEQNNIKCIVLDKNNLTWDKIKNYLYK